MEDKKEIKDKKENSAFSFGIGANNYNNNKEIAILKEERITDIVLLLVSMFVLKITTPTVLIMQEDTGAFTALLFFGGLIGFITTLSLAIGASNSIKRLIKIKED